MKQRTELIVNIILIFIGMTGGIVFHITGYNPLSVVLFAIALSSILYKFMGGIKKDNKFSLGAIKFGGSAAIIAGFMFILSEYILDDNHVAELSISQESGWLPIDAESGKTLQINVSAGTKSKTFPNSADLAKREGQQFKVSETEPGSFNIYTEGMNKEAVGTFNRDAFDSQSLFNEIIIDEKDEKRIQVFKLYPDNPSKDSTADLEELELPFEIVAFRKTRFKVVYNGKIIIKNREIVKQTAHVVQVSDKSAYIIFLEHASSIINNDYPERYSKWLVKKISLEFSS